MESSGHSTHTVIESNIYFSKSIDMIGENCKAERLKDASMKKKESRRISTVPPDGFMRKKRKQIRIFQL